MIPTSLREVWKRRAALMEEEQEDEVVSTTAAHDLILRYALVGIFLILFTASLSLARSVALPVTAGVVFGLVLGPVVDRMVRLGMPHTLSAALVVLAGVALMTLVIGIFAAPFALWSDRLPGIIATLKGRVADIADLAKRFEGLAGGLTTTTAAPKVAVEEPSPLVSIAITSSAAAGSALIFIATIYFYLATRRHLKARALRLCLGSSARRSAGAFLGGIENRIASYFGVVTVINLAVGLVATGIAWLAGLPFPLFWGLVAFILNYIAFVGPAIMTALLLGASLLDDGARWTAAWPALAYFVIHLIEGNIITPLMVGRRLTVSPFLVFISFVFWLWLWGPVGAVLSTPILLIASLSFEAVRHYRELEEETAAVAATPKATEARRIEEAEANAIEAVAEAGPMGSAPSIADPEPGDEPARDRRRPALEPQPASAA